MVAASIHFDIKNERFLKLSLPLGEDSDSECHTSSTEDSPQAGPPSGARAPQKRERPRKKPAPQAPRNVAIPVAMPIAPAVIPPRLPPPTQVRTPADSEQGEILETYLQFPKMNVTLKVDKRY